ncbi:DUF4229 domain-containing protein [Yinghuangia sp. YIM S09857]|uniref:DUF4229 domain-containing protein n=1 Tax=Yinghuangia sp. YIM S09857 TaxID=3436929 RepID=UPI003F534F2A
MSTAHSTPQNTPEPQSDAPGAAEPARRSGTWTNGHPALRYTLYRLGVFAAAFAVIWAVFYALDIGGKGAPILVAGLAVAVSGLVSYFLLNSQRDAMSAALVERVERAKARIEEGASAEDHLVADNAPRPTPRTTPRTTDAT